MLKHDKIDITEGIDFNKTNKSKECMFCHYWYYLNKSFKNIAIIYIKKN